MAVPKSHARLPLHEEALLLALRDDAGIEEPYANLDLGLGAAILAELLLQERVSVERLRRRDFLKLESDSSTGDAVLDDALARLAAAKRRARLSTWVLRFSRVKGLMHRVAERLCEQGVLHLGEGRVLWLFKRRVYPELDGRVEDEILGRLQEAIFTQTSDLDPRTAALVCLGYRTGLLQANFNRTKLEECRDRLEQLSRGELVDGAAMRALSAVFVPFHGASGMPGAAMVATI